MSNQIVSELPILRRVSENVVSVEEAKELRALLQDVLASSPSGIGLSAIQIGRARCISVIRSADKSFYTIINPVILEQDERFVFFGEGCLSFPRVFKNTNRYKHFVIKNSVIDGDSFREETQYYHYEDGNSYRDIETIAVQHEIDHMNGVLFFDRESEAHKPIIATPKVGRNDQCPCGSGKKYKKCCGLVGAV